MTHLYNLSIFWDTLYMRTMVSLPYNFNHDSIAAEPQNWQLDMAHALSSSILWHTPNYGTLVDYDCPQYSVLAEQSTTFQRPYRQIHFFLPFSTSSQNSLSWQNVPSERPSCPPRLHWKWILIYNVPRKNCCYRRCLWHFCSDETVSRQATVKPPTAHTPIMESK